MRNLTVNGDHFIDPSGQTQFLRGVNLGGSTKVPSKPFGATYNRDGFFNHHDVSFVGKPFPLSEADEHFGRLKSWGFNFLRFLVTWEAIEHSGPGIYDEEYLDYLVQVVKKASEYDLNLFIDPHEDVWSRFTGGDGAPGWTLELAGFDLRNLHTSGAAFVHCMNGDPYPRMLWPTNNHKLAAATMFTLFFGGKDFAPKMTIDGVNIQEVLQDHYINAIRQVALRLKEFPNVIGYDCMNEPAHGWIGCKDPTRDTGRVTLFESPTVLQSMALGEGIPQRVGYWRLNLLGLIRTGSRVINANGIRAWRTGKKCVWRTEGVWDVDMKGNPVILKPDHFTSTGSRPVDFSRDYLLPFFQRFTKAIREVDPECVIFIEEEPDRIPSLTSIDELKPVVNAAHWYDVMTLLSKRYFQSLAIDFLTDRIVLGKKRVENTFIKQLSLIKQSSKEMGGVPTLIGEFGIPFDMYSKNAYQTGDFSKQIAALDRSYRAMEANLLDSTLWNYTADNNNHRGDLWNDEDFSIFSEDQLKEATNLDSGGRAWQAFLRPHPRSIAGTANHFSFDYHTGTMVFHYIGNQSDLPTELFIPSRQYPNGIEVTLSDGSYEYLPEQQIMRHFAMKSRKEHHILIRRAKTT